MAKGKRWIRGVVASLVGIVLLGTAVGLFGLKRMANTAATLPGWQKKAGSQGLALDFKELTPPNLSDNAAELYLAGKYKEASTKPLVWFEWKDKSSRRLVEVATLRKAFEELRSKDVPAATRVLRHAGSLPFREGLRLRLEGEKTLRTAKHCPELDTLLGPLPDPGKSLRGELARDRARLNRKWQQNSPIDFFMAKDFVEARMIELWSQHYEAVRSAKTPEQVEQRMQELDAAIDGRRLISRFMRYGYGDIGTLYREVSELRSHGLGRLDSK